MIRNIDIQKSLFLGPLRLAAYVLLIGCLLLGLSYSSTAHAGTLTLSTHVSSQLDPNGAPLPDPIDLADLDATFDFNISGDIVELTVTNLTSGDELFDINEVYFNVTSNVTGLTYNKATHSVANNVKNVWSFVADDGTPDFAGTHGDGFGIHDFSLMYDGGPGPKDIGPTESIMFRFTISGAGPPFAMSDFTTTLSRQTTGGTNTLMLATAKFVRRRDSSGNEILPNDSGYGGAVPEPGSAMLLALGALSLLGYRGRCALL